MLEHTCSVYLDCISYEQGLRYQSTARQLVNAGVWDAIFLVMQHDRVITVGMNGGDDNLRVSENILKEKKISVVHTNRGGNITCHNPGQVVCYPVVNLKKWHKDVHLYVHEVEEVLIQTLGEFGIHAGRKSAYTGVWVGNKKIAAIGIGVKAWTTFHGLALNVENDLSFFSYVIPCGIEKFGVTSLRGQGCEALLAQVVDALVHNLSALFTDNRTETISDWSGIYGRENFTEAELVGPASI